MSDLEQKILEARALAEKERSERVTPITPRQRHLALVVTKLEEALLWARAEPEGVLRDDR